MNPTPKGRPLFPLFFLGVGLLFVGILVYVYLVSRKVNPELLDEKGQRIPARQT